MKSSKWIVLGLVGALVQGSQAAMEAGDKEVGGNFSIIKPSEGDAVWLAFGSIGYYTTAKIKVSGNVFVFGGDDTSGSVGGGVDYFFDGSNELIPYVGAGLSVDVGSDADSDLLIDLHAGIKHFVSEKVSMNYEAKYMTSSDDTSSGTTMGSIGFSVLF